MAVTVLPMFSGPMGELKIKRIYDAPEPSDGERFLVDRLWPRGISKEKAELSDWVKDIAPSQELRKWFNHEEEKYPEFSKKYTTELESNPDASDFKQKVNELLKTENVTLLFAAKSDKLNNAVVLSAWISGSSSS